MDCAARAHRSILSQQHTTPSTDSRAFHSTQTSFPNYPIDWIRVTIYGDQQMMPLGQLPAIRRNPRLARNSKRKECRGPKTYTSKQKSKQHNLFRKNIEEYFDHKAQYVFSSPTILHKTKTNASFIFATMDPHSRKERQTHRSMMHLPWPQHFHC